jgi:glycerol uptake facilitator-like aquaporin
VLLSRRLAAEALGSAFLLVAVVGSGIMAQRLTTDVGVQLLANAVATGGALVGLILLFGSVSGAHFNPAVTVTAALHRELSWRDTGAYAVAQLVGGCVGVMAANVMFELDVVNVSTRVRDGGALWFSEALATFGLVVLINGIVRSGRGATVPFAVAAWITGAYWFTSSTSFANPMVSVARTLSDTFAGIAPASAPMFVVSQFVGAALAYPVVRFLWPIPPPDADTAQRSRSKN